MVVLMVAVVNLVGAARFVVTVLAAIIVAAVQLEVVRLMLVAVHPMVARLMLAAVHLAAALR